MKTFLNTAYQQHDAAGEIHHGALVPCFENPSRLDNIIATFKENGIIEFTAPNDYGREPITAVHDTDYVSFLETIHSQWIAAGNKGDVVPYLWPVPGLKRMKHPNLSAKVGSYAFSSDSPITSYVRLVVASNIY